MLAEFGPAARDFIFMARDNRLNLWKVEPQKQRHTYVEKNHLAHSYTCLSWRHGNNGSLLLLLRPRWLDSSLLFRRGFGSGNIVRVRPRRRLGCNSFMTLFIVLDHDACTVGYHMYVASWLRTRDNVVFM